MLRGTVHQARYEHREVGFVADDHGALAAALHQLADQADRITSGRHLPPDLDRAGCTAGLLRLADPLLQIGHSGDDLRGLERTDEGARDDRERRFVCCQQGARDGAGSLSACGRQGTIFVAPRRCVVLRRPVAHHIELHAAHPIANRRSAVHPSTEWGEATATENAGGLQCELLSSCRFMRARQWWSCLLALPLTCLATTGIAEGAEEQPRSLVLLEWTRGRGADACPSESELIEDVERSLARRAFADQAHADRVLRVEIQRADAAPQWLARIALATPSGRHLGRRDLTIDSESCEEASESLVLALALMIDLPPTPEELADERERRRVPWHSTGKLGPSAAVDMSSSGGVGGGAHASVVLVPGSFWPLIADAFFWGQGESVPEGRTVRLFRTMFGLGVCPLTIPAGRFVMTACIGPQAELAVAWGSGFGKDRSGMAVRFGGLAQASATYRLGERVHAFAAIGFAATPQRSDFTVLDDRRVERSLYRGSPVTGIGSFGVALDFF